MRRGAAADLEPGAGGHFGSWITDRWGLPVYEYTCDHRTDPKAAYVAMGSERRRHWHQLGNDRIVAIADNDGRVQVFQNEGGAKWLNYLDPDVMQLAGGVVWATDGQRTVCTEHGAEGPDLVRQFGVGYFLKTVAARGYRLEQRVFAPFGDAPLLVSATRVTNESGERRPIDVFEYWGSYQYQLAYDAFLASVPVADPSVTGRQRAKLARRFAETIDLDEASGALVSEWQHEDRGRTRRDEPSFHDLRPPVTFLAALGGPDVVGYETSAQAFFGADGVAVPSAVRGRCCGSVPYRVAVGEPHRGCLVLQRRLTLEAGASIRLAHAFGYARAAGEIHRLLSPYRDDSDDLFERTMAAWKASLPRFECDGAPWAAREATWNAYYLRSGATRDEYFEAPALSQGCTYQYDVGFNAAARDPLQHALPLVVYAPEIARGVLEMTLAEAGPEGTIPYAVCGHGRVAPVLWEPSDHDLWALWLAAEYVLATRDVDALGRTVPFYPRAGGRSATVLGHLKVALTHLLEHVGFGKHGLLRVQNNDWNDGVMDEIPEALRGRAPKKGESVLNSAMATYVLPYAAELFDLAGDAIAAGRARDAARQLARSLHDQWSGRWYPRVYAGDDDGGEEVWIGRDALYLEPQTWAILGGVARGERLRTLVRCLDEHLRGRSPIGAPLYHPLERARERSSQFGGDPGSCFLGGIWYALNGPLVWALAEHEPDLAWDELRKNSFAAHASAYPDVWFGIWSGPDAYNSVVSDRPGRTWGGPPLVDMNQFPVMNLHSHAWPLYALTKLLGISYDARGLVLRPRVPLPVYSFDSPLVGLARSDDRLSGHYAPIGPGRVELRVELPAGWAVERAAATADGLPVGVRVQGRRIGIALDAPGDGEPVSFEVRR